MYIFISQEGYIRHARGITALLDKTLQNPIIMVYQRNEYYWCVINKKFNGKQCNILCNVDDMKILHVDSDIFSSDLADIDAE